MKFLIVAVMIIGLSVVAGSVIVGNMVFDGTVTEHPYETALLWDKMHREKEKSGLSVRIRNEEGIAVGTNALAVEVLDRADKPVEGASVSITVSRPSTAAYDKTYNCARLNDGSCRAVVVFPRYGYWDLRIRVVRAQSDIVYSKQVFAKR